MRYFPDPVSGWVFLSALAGVLGVASYFDERYTKIPKWLTLRPWSSACCSASPAAGGSPPTAWTSGCSPRPARCSGPSTARCSLPPGWWSGSSSSSAIWLLGGCGGGDVKLFAALGAWLGPYLVFCVLIVSLILLFVCLVSVLAWRGVGSRVKRDKDGKKCRWWCGSRSSPPGRPAGRPVGVPHRPGPDAAAGDRRDGGGGQSCSLSAEAERPAAAPSRWNCCSSCLCCSPSCSDGRVLPLADGPAAGQPRLPRGRAGGGHGRQPRRHQRGRQHRPRRGTVSAGDGPGHAHRRERRPGPARTGRFGAGAAAGQAPPCPICSSSSG